MYTHFFNLTHSPFSIAPDPRFLFMSERHREALAHLLYGVNGGGGFVLLTGEIGAGKTTVCRCFLEQIPENCNVGYIFNPQLTGHELLKSICDEFRVEYQVENGTPTSAKTYIDALNTFLLTAHANGRHNVLIIDEAQNLSASILEQLRLLTNLETSERKLLQIILIGQPELRMMLAQSKLQQLAQRIIARYHLDSLSPDETGSYITHRLTVAGLHTVSPFPAELMKQIHRLTQGVPRRINLLCDRALLGAYAEGKLAVNRRILDKAAGEIFGDIRKTKPSGSVWRYAGLGLIGGMAIAGAAVLAILGHGHASNATTSSLPLQPAMAVPPAPGGSKISPGKAVSNPLAYPGYDFNGAASDKALDANIAYRHLAALWGEHQLAAGDPCQVVQQVKLRCYPSNKGFAEIRELHRPALLTLHDVTNRLYYAVLIGLSESQAILMIGEQIYSVKPTDLARHFDGDFVTLWRALPTYRDKIHRDDTGEDVDWVTARLAKLGDTPLSGGQQIYDIAASRKIREFQMAQGLDADGIVGPKTYMQLSHATDNLEPRLQDHVMAMPETRQK